MAEVAERSGSSTAGSGLLEIAGDGAMTGLYGAATVALWFLAVDAWLREPFYTPSLVGTAVLAGGGPVDPAAPIDLLAVGVYTAVHSVSFILFGTVYAWALARLRETPALPLIAISVFVPLELGFVGGTRLFVPGVAETLGHGYIAVGNVAAAIAMALYLRFGEPHPGDRTDGV